jgi:hypothetical protein
MTLIKAMSCKIEEPTVLFHIGFYIYDFSSGKGKLAIQRLWKNGEKVNYSWIDRS